MVLYSIMSIHANIKLYYKAVSLLAVDGVKSHVSKQSSSNSVSPNFPTRSFSRSCRLSSPFTAFNSVSLFPTPAAISVNLYPRSRRLSVSLSSITLMNSEEEGVVRRLVSCQRTHRSRSDRSAQLTLFTIISLRPLTSSCGLFPL